MSGIDKHVLLHFHPFPFVNTNQVATITPDLVSIVNAVVLHYAALPAVQHSSLADLHISVDFIIADGTSHRSGSGWVWATLSPQLLLNGNYRTLFLLNLTKIRFADTCVSELVVHLNCLLILARWSVISEAIQYQSTEPVCCDARNRCSLLF